MLAASLIALNWKHYKFDGQRQALNVGGRAIATTPCV